MRNLVSRIKNCQTSNAGFTLIEVLVALAIAALGLSALIAAAGQGMGNVNAADTYLEATRRAQSHLATLGVFQPVAEGTHSGDDGGGFSWRLQVSPVARDVLVNGRDRNILCLYDVFMTISWKKGGAQKQVTLTTRRIAHVAP